MAATVLPDAPPLFARHCAACHGPDAMGDGKLAPALGKPPANLRRGPFLWSPNGPELETRLARIIKFGVPGTDMPGHETLTDAQVLALARYVLGLRP
jgi:cytochrome c oxidase cbb3-type subunit 2